MASRKSTDLELVIWNYVRNEYENKYDKQHIPVALKYVVVGYSKRFIPCDFLSIKEDLLFCEIFSNKIGKDIKSFKILYKASDHNFSSDTFHKLCDGESPTITLIKSNFGNIFGGFTSKPLPTFNYCQRDEDAYNIFAKL